MRMKMAVLVPGILGFAILVPEVCSQQGPKNLRPLREAAWKLPVVEAPGLQYGIFVSEAAGEEVSYLIYLPAAYEENPDARFPVVYWLHGIGGSQRGVPRMCEQFTEAIAQGKAPPMLLVFVNGMLDSFYCDAVNARRPVETVIIKELIPHIDAKYRTVAGREGRMIEGFSMGGFGAARLGFKYPGLFGAVSIIDGALLDTQAMTGRHGEQFARIFDSQPEAFLAAHPVTLAEANVAEIKDRMVIRQVSGKLAAGNEMLHRELERLGIAHEYDAFPDAGHSVSAIYGKLGERNWEFYNNAFGGGKN